MLRAYAVAAVMQRGERCSEVVPDVQRPLSIPSTGAVAERSLEALDREMQQLHGGLSASKAILGLLDHSCDQLNGCPSPEEEEDAVDRLSRCGSRVTMPLPLRHWRPKLPVLSVDGLEGRSVHGARC